MLAPLPAAPRGSDGYRLAGRISQKDAHESCFHNGAAAATAPVPLKAALFVTTISTGYCHSIYLFHPVIRQHVKRLLPRPLTYPSMQTSCQSISQRKAQ